MTCPCYAVLGDNRHHSIMGAGRCAAPCVADAAPILTALGASVVIAGSSGRRSVPMEEFYVWSGETVVGPGEIIMEIEVPHRPFRKTQRFEKSAGWEGDFADARSRPILSSTALCDGRAHLAGRGCTLAGARRRDRQALLGGDLSDARIRTAAEKTVRGALPLSGNRYKADLLVNLAERAIHRCLS